MSEVTVDEGFPIRGRVGASDGERWTVRVGGSELVVRSYADQPGDPRVDPPKPVLVIWPALGVPGRFYRPFAITLRERGFGVVIADYRGQGENKPRIGRADRFGYHELASVDLAGVVLVAAGTPYFRAYPGLLGLRILLSIQFVNAVAAVVGYWPGDRLRFAGRQSRVLVRDWARINRTGRFRFAGNSAYDDDLAGVEAAGPRGFDRW